MQLGLYTAAVYSSGYAEFQGDPVIAIVVTSVARRGTSCTYTDPRSRPRCNHHRHPTPPCVALRPPPAANPAVRIQMQAVKHRWTFHNSNGRRSRPPTDKMPRLIPVNLSQFRAIDALAAKTNYFSISTWARSCQDKFAAVCRKKNIWSSGFWKGGQSFFQNDIILYAIYDAVW